MEFISDFFQGFLLELFQAIFRNFSRNFSEDFCRYFQDNLSGSLTGFVPVLFGISYWIFSWILKSFLSKLFHKLSPKCLSGLFTEAFVGFPSGPHYKTILGFFFLFGSILLTDFSRNSRDSFWKWIQGFFPNFFHWKYSEMFETTLIGIPFLNFPEIDPRIFARTLPGVLVEISPQILLRIHLRIIPRFPWHFSSASLNLIQGFSPKF